VTRIDEMDAYVENGYFGRRTYARFVTVSLASSGAHASPINSLWGGV
jgi:hypothetical protein